MFSQLSNVHFFTNKKEKLCPNLLCIIFFNFYSTLSTGPVMLLRFGSALSSFCSTKSLAFWQQPAAGGAFKAIFWPTPGLTFDSHRWDGNFFIHGTHWDLKIKKNKKICCLISPWGKYVSNLVFYTHHHGGAFQCHLWCQNLQQGSARLLLLGATETARCCQLWTSLLHVINISPDIPLRGWLGSEHQLT